MSIYEKQSRYYIEKYLKDMNFIISHINKEEIITVIDILHKARDTNKTIYIMGNGGSASNASHFINGLSQGATVDGKPRFRAIALTDNIPNLLAYGNDYGYENVFVEQLKNLLNEGDIVIGISGSGKSPNIIRAIEYANNHKAITLGFIGFDGGILKSLVNHAVHIPSFYMEHIEDVHLMISHLISSFFKEEVNK